MPEGQLRVRRADFVDLVAADEGDVGNAVRRKRVERAVRMANALRRLLEGNAASGDEAVTVTFTKPPNS